MTDYIAERDRRITHLAALPGFRAKEYGELLDRATHSFNINGRALAYQVARYTATLTPRQDLGDEYSYDLANALFNFLASAGTLRDAQRVVHRRIWPMRRPNTEACVTCGKISKQSVPSEWEEQVYRVKLAEVFGNDASFLLKLRDYAVHYELPLPRTHETISWGEGGPVTYERIAPLSTQKLLEWDGWSRAAKSYLHAQGEWIDFRSAISSYTKSVRIFHEWFLATMHQELQFEEYTSKADELRLWLDEKNSNMNWLAGGNPIPPDLEPGGRIPLRKPRAIAKKNRWANGSRSWTIHSVDKTGCVTLGPVDGWGPLPA